MFGSLFIPVLSLHWIHSFTHPPPEFL
jgi:hypothetical protein